jgi:tRNA(His) guanylyltransferase
MNPDDFEKRMRSLEYFSSLRMLPGVWPIIRVDGRGFARKTAALFTKPFDTRFRDIMVTTAQTLLEELQGIYAYTMSDEISLLLPLQWGLFDRRLEKTVSVSAGVASAAFTQALGEPAHFDSRVWLGTDSSLVADYFAWRQAEAAANALHGWCYWTLRKSGKDIQEATAILKGKPVSFQNEMLFRHGINFNDLPVWQRRGVGLYREFYEKEGFDPKRRKMVFASRRRIRINQELPMKDHYVRFLLRIIQEYR